MTGRLKAARRVGLCGIEKHEDQRIDGVGDRRQSRPGPRLCPGAAGRRLHQNLTKIEQVSSAAGGILINNAGVARFVPALGAPTMDDARLEIEANYLGTLAMCRAFAPVLKRNGGGVLVNMRSVVSFAKDLGQPARFALASQGKPGSAVPIDV
jgi:NAD(P)-dependent dehydrogenase (short-subunit alcohol dehydrogenase family)